MVVDERRLEERRNSLTLRYAFELFTTPEMRCMRSVDRPFAHASESGAKFRLPGNAWKDTVATQVHRIFGRLAISANRRGVLMPCQTLQTHVRRNRRPILYIANLVLTFRGQRFSTKHRSFNGSAALAGFRLFQMDVEIGKVATSDVRNANTKK